MPAVTPAEVQTAPSRTKIGSGSTFMVGYRRARSPQTDQCVATRRPSNAPVAASRNAPVQTDATRCARLARCRTQSTSAGSAVAASTPGPPRHDQRVHRDVHARQRVRRNRKPRRGGDAFAPFGHHPQNIGRGAAALHNLLVGGGEHLKRPGDVEQLHIGIGQYFDDTGRADASGSRHGSLRRASRLWRKTRALWHISHTLPAYDRLVHLQSGNHP